jgi:hypothetical protein
MRLEKKLRAFYTYTAREADDYDYSFEMPNVKVKSNTLWRKAFSSWHRHLSWRLRRNHSASPQLVATRAKSVSVISIIVYKSCNII